MAAAMLAAFCPSARRVELQERSVPVPGPGEAVVRVRACGICGSDLHWFGGEFPPPPVCPGHEMAGEVAAAGAGCTARPGDRVTIEPLVVCRVCADCRAGHYQRCRHLEVLGIARDGGLAEQVLVPEYALHRVPDNVDLDLAALAEPTAVCVHAIRLANVRLGDRALVLGAGTIGLLSVLAARAAGASDIAITARHPHQAEAARRLGATQVFATTADGVAARDAFVEQHAVDVVVETVGGAAPTLDEALHAVRPGGTVSLLGVFTVPPPLNLIAILMKEIRVVGSFVYGRPGARTDFDVALDLLRTHADAARTLLTHRFPLTAVQAAFETAADKRQGAIKVVVRP
jgi:2-desacetyl-2-hydroxyethyl bacteriochlorophyllide A dehydrogenase